MLLLKRLRILKMLIPKFYHSKKYDVIKYSARPVGFWRRFSPFRFFPYTTGDVIQIHVEIKRIGEEWWQQGNLRIDPKKFYKKPILGKKIVATDFRFQIEEIQQGETWSRILSLKGGTDFKYSCRVACYLELKRIGNKTSKNTIKIANIEVVSGFLLLSATIFITLSILAIIVPIIRSVFDC